MTCVASITYLERQFPEDELKALLGLPRVSIVLTDSIEGCPIEACRVPIIWALERILDIQACEDGLAVDFLHDGVGGREHDRARGRDGPSKAPRAVGLEYRQLGSGEGQWESLNNIPVPAVCSWCR